MDSVIWDLIVKLVKKAEEPTVYQELANEVVVAKQNQDCPILEEIMQKLVQYDPSINSQPPLQQRFNTGPLPHLAPIHSTQLWKAGNHQIQLEDLCYLPCPSGCSYCSDWAVQNFINGGRWCPICYHNYSDAQLEELTVLHISGKFAHLQLQVQRANPRQAETNEFSFGNAPSTQNFMRQNAAPATQLPPPAIPPLPQLNMNYKSAPPYSAAPSNLSDQQAPFQNIAKPPVFGGNPYQTSNAPFQQVQQTCWPNHPLQTCQQITCGHIVHIEWVVNSGYVCPIMQWGKPLNGGDMKKFGY